MAETTRKIEHTATFVVSQGLTGVTVGEIRDRLMDFEPDARVFVTLRCGASEGSFLIIGER